MHCLIISIISGTSEHFQDQSISPNSWLVIIIITQTCCNCTPNDSPCARCKDSTPFGGPGNGYDKCICVHAEQNALLTCAKFGNAAAGSTIYTTLYPCFGCFKELLQVGIVRIVYEDVGNVPNNFEALVQSLGKDKLL